MPKEARKRPLIAPDHPYPPPPALHTCPKRLAAGICSTARGLPWCVRRILNATTRTHNRPIAEQDGPFIFLRARGDHLGAYGKCIRSVSVAWGGFVWCGVVWCGVVGVSCDVVVDPVFGPSRHTHAHARTNKQINKHLYSPVRIDYHSRRRAIGAVEIGCEGTAVGVVYYINKQ